MTNSEQDNTERRDPLLEHALTQQEFARKHRPPDALGDEEGITVLQSPVAERTETKDGSTVIRLRPPAGGKAS